jgi:hypothetical protein
MELFTFVFSGVGGWPVDGLVELVFEDTSNLSFLRSRQDLRWSRPDLFSRIELSGADNA